MTFLRGFSCARVIPAQMLLLSNPGHATQSRVMPLRERSRECSHVDAGSGAEIILSIAAGVPGRLHNDDQPADAVKISALCLRLQLPDARHGMSLLFPASMHANPRLHAPLARMAFKHAQVTRPLLPHHTQYPVASSSGPAAEAACRPLLARVPSTSLPASDILCRAQVDVRSSDMTDLRLGPSPAHAHALYPLKHLVLQSGQMKAACFSGFSQLDSLDLHMSHMTRLELCNCPALTDAVWPSLCADAPPLAACQPDRLGIPPRTRAGCRNLRWGFHSCQSLPACCMSCHAVKC